jgi:hypothetical protein
MSFKNGLESRRIEFDNGDFRQALALDGGCPFSM